MSASKLDVVMSQVSEEEAEELFRALMLGKKVVSHSVLARTLTKNGHPVDERSVRRWRDSNAKPKSNGTDKA